MRYPRQQAEVAALVDQMIGGITEHGDIFTHCDAAALQNARDEFEQASAALTAAKAEFVKAAVEKLEKFNQLQTEMKKQIKLGTVDTSDNPVELSYIGWGPKREPQDIEPPAQPVNLKIIAQGDNGMICLVWNKSRYSYEKPNGCGPVRSYSIERKQFNGNWSEWQLVGSSFNNEIKLTKQPIGIKLEYQVKAGNSSGQSFPSNTVAVVL